ncbi:DedA family protein [Nonomuraea sp. NPDC047897]|uniref:DedA family protein n=1 Tax=Nonomuraea sp. NPDC047897 TaxID=3364346 RepID=UPI00371588BA
MGGTRHVTRILDFLSSLHPMLLCAATTLFMCVETSLLVGLFVPGDAVVLLAGSAADTPGRLALVIAAATAGCLAGETLGYLIGRRFGPSVRRGRAGRRVGAANWARAENYLVRRGGPAVFGSRFVTVVHALVPVVAGTLAMPYRRFIAWAAPAALVWSCLYAGAGMALGASHREFGSGLGAWSWLVPPVIVGCVVGCRLLLRRLRRPAGPEAGRPGEAP